MSKTLLDFLEKLNREAGVGEKGVVDSSVIEKLGWSPEAISAFSIKKTEKKTEKACPSKCGCSVKTGAGEGKPEEEFEGNCGSSCGCSSNAGAGCNGAKGHHVKPGKKPEHIR
jgi:hypothetical protein